MATAIHSFSGMVRQQIEQTLAAKGARLESGQALAPRLVREGFDTGFLGLDAVLHGGIPVAGTTEIIGGKTSGRATIAVAYLAQQTREGHVCAWVDVAGDLDPSAAAANGVDFARVLWVRCVDVCPPRPSSVQPPIRASENRPSASFARDKSVGTPGVANRMLGEVRQVQVSEDRLPKRRGAAVVQRHQLSAPVVKSPIGNTAGAEKQLKPSFSGQKKPLGRLEKAVKSIDLLVHSGGFGAIVLDMGGIDAEMARKIPLATWFRWRAALERTRCSLLVLSPINPGGAQLGCSGSSAELVLRVAAGIPAPGTVMTGVPYRVEVVRRRFARDGNGFAAEGRKGVMRAAAWESRTGWVAS